MIGGAGPSGGRRNGHAAGKRVAGMRITEAEGIARAHRIVAESLTREYLQHEVNVALQGLARHGNTSTVVVPASRGVAPLINPPAPPVAAARR